MLFRMYRPTSDGSIVHPVQTDDRVVAQYVIRGLAQQQQVVRGTSTRRTRKSKQHTTFLPISSSTQPSHAQHRLRHQIQHAQIPRRHVLQRAHPRPGLVHDQPPRAPLRRELALEEPDGEHSRPQAPPGVRVEPRRRDGGRHGGLQDPQLHAQLHGERGPEGEGPLEGLQIDQRLGRGGQRPLSLARLLVREPGGREESGGGIGYRNVFRRRLDLDGGLLGRLYDETHRL